MYDLLWLVVAGTRGGVNRGRILSLLGGRPYNAHQIAETLEMDYKTVRHHLAILAEHRLIAQKIPGQYGGIWTLTPRMRASETLFQTIWTQFVRESRAHTKPAGSRRGASPEV